METGFSPGWDDSSSTWDRKSRSSPAETATLQTNTTWRRSAAVPDADDGWNDSLPRTSQT